MIVEFLKFKRKKFWKIRLSKINQIIFVKPNKMNLLDLSYYINKYSHLTSKYVVKLLKLLKLYPTTWYNGFKFQIFELFNIISVSPVFVIEISFIWHSLSKNFKISFLVFFNQSFETQTNDMSFTILWCFFAMLKINN